MDILFGEDADAVESNLQLRVVSLLISVGRNGNGAADAQEGATEGLGNHAFENPNNKAGYREGDAKDAWNKTVEFFATNLKH